jgi:hypothetical protein
MSLIVKQKGRERELAALFAALADPTRLRLAQPDA